MYFEWFTPNRHVPVPRLTPLLFHQWTGNGHRWRVSHTNCTCFQFNSVDWSNDASYAANNLADVSFPEECFARLWIAKVNKKNVFVCCRVMFRSSLSQICSVENIAAGRVFGDFFFLYRTQWKNYLVQSLFDWCKSQAEQFYIIHKHFFFLQFSY